jgi:ribonucleoside-diphosphate reductase beta chain
MSVFDLNANRDSVNRKTFFDGPVTLARYDKQKYNFLEKLTEKQLGFFWRPEEVEIIRDSKDFKDLTDNERHIFTSNLKRQILLDSVQGRAPILAFGPPCSLPELETWLTTWTFFETIHSRSYTYIIRNVYSDPSVVFDEMLDIQEIAECADDISKYYDELIKWNHMRESGGHDYHSYDLINDTYEHKRILWLALNSVNVLEGIRFYVSFACSWAFAELKKMEGNAKIIKFIARDENLHLASSQQLIKALVKEDDDFAKIAEDTKEECVGMFLGAAVQEKAWAHYLFKEGSMIGLNEKLLGDYVDWITHKRMTSIGLPSPLKGGSNPLPWTQKWISGSDVQVAPQETQITSYLVGGVTKDVTEDSFKGFTL